MIKITNLKNGAKARILNINNYKIKDLNEIVTFWESKKGYDIEVSYKIF